MRALLTLCVAMLVVAKPCLAESRAAYIVTPHQKLSESASNLASALRRFGFESYAVPLLARQAPKPVIVMKSVRKDARNDRLTLVLDGVKLKGDQLVVPSFNGGHLSVASLLAEIHLNRQAKAEVFLFLDTEVTADRDTAERIVSALLSAAAYRDKPGGLSTHVWARFLSAPPRKPRPSLTAKLSDVLTFDRRADLNRDNDLSWRELVEYLQTGSSDTVVEASSHASPGDRIVCHYANRNLEMTLSDLASEAVRLAHFKDLERIVIVPTLYENKEDLVYGDLMQFLSARVRKLLSKDHGVKGIPSIQDMVTWLTTAGITPSKVTEEFEAIARVVSAQAPESQGPLGILVGRCKADPKDREQQRLFPQLAIVVDGKLHQTIDLNQGAFKLTRNDQAIATHSERVAMSRLARLNDDLTTAHPMNDKAFYPQIYLDVDGACQEPVFADSRMSVSVKAGDQYRILIDNTGGNQDLFMKLFVDGKNTLPDQPGIQRPAVDVPIADARCWFCEKGKRYYVSGFYGDIVKGRRTVRSNFQVDNTLGSGLLDTWNPSVGTITAAFYKPVEKHLSAMSRISNFATVPGARALVKVKAYKGDKAPANDFFEIIKLEYGF